MAADFILIANPATANTLEMITGAIQKNVKEKNPTNEIDQNLIGENQND
jgi:hypothetical protein